MTCDTVKRSDHVEVSLWPWLTLELPREIVEGLTPGELADCTDAARCEVVRLLRLRAGGPLGGGLQ